MQVESGVHLAVFDAERSMYCLATSEAPAMTVWEWWAVDISHPLLSRHGIARSPEAAQEAARRALAVEEVHLAE